MNEYRVWQKAEVWYYTSIEAESEEQAIEFAKSGTRGTGWDIDLDGVSMIEEYEAYKEENN